jgi:catechol 2,3-dioxygenase
MMQGFADHGVSEALYLADPDGNGVEIYRDRPRAEWPFAGGALKMVSDPLDVEEVLSVAADQPPREAMPPGTIVGHIHLHVADLDAAERFYREAVGFDLVQRYGRTASFLSAGGYHHHVAVNTWAGIGAPPPPPGAIGLDHAVIRVADESALDEIARSLEAAGAAFTMADGELRAPDPSANQLVFRIS